MITLHPDITATFYTDKFMRERSFFEMWQKAAFSNTSHNINLTIMIMFHQ